MLLCVPTGLHPGGGPGKAGYDMSLERIRVQLEKLGLAKPDNEQSITMMPIGPFLLFADASGVNLLIIREDYMGQQFNKIAFKMQTLSWEEFWSGRWLDTFMRYQGLEPFWAHLKAEAVPVSVAAPQTEETVGIGRAKKISPGGWLFEAETGEYAFVPHKETGKWILS